MRKKLSLIVIVCFMASIASCGHVTIPSTYTSSSGYSSDMNVRVFVRKVEDQRGVDGKTFFVDTKDLMNGYYDKPISEIVRDALIAEFRNAGMKTCNDTSDACVPQVILDCEIEDFGMMLEFGSDRIPRIRTTETLIFRWIDPETESLVSVKKRKAESVTQRVDPTEKLSLNPFSPADKKALRENGRKLKDEMLPELIHKELRYNSYIGKLGET